MLALLCGCEHSDRGRMRSSSLVILGLTACAARPPARDSRGDGGVVVCAALRRVRPRTQSPDWLHPLGSHQVWRFGPFSVLYLHNLSAQQSASWQQQAAWRSRAMRYWPMALQLASFALSDRQQDQLQTTSGQEHEAAQRRNG